MPYALFRRSVYNRRRNPSFTKYILLVIIITVLILWICKQIRNIFVPNIPLDPENSNLTFAERQILEERRKVLKENTDEFLDSVLEEYKYTEIEFWRKKVTLSGFDDYDEEIREYLNKIVPGMGVGGRNSSVPESQKVKAAEIMKKEAANILLSDMISPNRTLPDTRMNACIDIDYALDLPDASIVIIYHNEAFSTLLRSIHSVMNRSPSNLLKEVILVDDFSNKKELQGRLERYLSTRFPVGKIRLVRIHKRAGLIRARMIGAHLATGAVIVFLDAHCEVGYSWLEPMLERIKEERTVVTCPVIEAILSTTLALESLGDTVLVAGFGWKLYFNWLNVPDHEIKRKNSLHSPTKSASMAGGLFAIDRKYFWEIGSYDSGMKLWGGENLEMSFRIWQCGGSIEIIPCSKVGHIFHSTHPYSPGHENSHFENSVRVAEVWMDDFKELFYTAYGFKTNKFGDLSRRLALKERLKCKNFAWYLKNVYNERFWKPSGGWSHFGQVMNSATNKCLDKMSYDAADSGYKLEVVTCHTRANFTKAEQVFMLSKSKYSNSGELRTDLTCASSRDNGSDTHVEMIRCEYLKTSERWEYKDLNLKHVRTQKCLAVRIHDLVLENCNASLPTQKWTFEAPYTTTVT